MLHRKVMHNSKKC